jgi:hypothetical protein
MHILTKNIFVEKMLRTHASYLGEKNIRYMYHPQSVQTSVRQIGVTEQTYYRWRKEYGAGKG